MSDRFKNGMEARLGILGDEENASAEDLILTILEHQNRALALLAKKTTDRVDGFDVRLQGPQEAVFCDI